MSDPETPEDWQLVVDAVSFLLSVTAATQYGLITGAPEINEARCADLLMRGLKLGYRPAPMEELVKRFTAPAEKPCVTN